MSELRRFVLEYVEEAGGLVEAVAPDLHEVLLPQSLAESWQIPSYLQLSFEESSHEEALRLGYAHPLVEQMVDAAHSRTACSRLFIPALRLNKTGLEDVAAKEWNVVNGRIMPEKRAVIARVRSTYVRFNFKAAILSDEKQERLVSVLMDAHRGCRAAEPDTILLHARAVAPGELLPTLPDAPVRWQGPGRPPLKAPLEKANLEALLERAKSAVLHEMAPELGALQKRVARFQELDEARLNEYYEGLERDLQQRLAGASAERRVSLEQKLAAVRAEGAQKLADVAQRYRIGVDLTLLNLLVIQQPKLALRVSVENRATRLAVHAVWDPLLHQLEPLLCQVCGEPGGRFYLCFNGHLAHHDCLALPCMDCNRVFCRHCQDDVGQCDVCHGALCRHSRITCAKCGRHTCQAHQELCHANKGQPVDLAPGAKATPPKAQPTPPTSAPPTPASSKSPKPARRKSKGNPAAGKPAAGSSSSRTTLDKRLPRLKRIEVVTHSGAVAAYILGPKEKTVVMRTWELLPAQGGILRTCDCEKKDACPSTGMILRPPERQQLERLLRQEIAALCREYGLPAEKVHYNRISTLSGEPLPWPRFELFGLWKNEEALEEARATFSRLYWE